MRAPHASDLRSAPISRRGFSLCGYGYFYSVGPLDHRANVLVLEDAVFPSITAGEQLTAVASVPDDIAHLRLAGAVRPVIEIERQRRDGHQAPDFIGEAQLIAD